MLYVFILSDESGAKPTIFELEEDLRTPLVRTGIPSLDNLHFMDSNTVSFGSRWGSVTVNVGWWRLIPRFDPEKPPPKDDMPGGRVRSDRLHEREQLGHFLVAVFRFREEAEAWDPKEVLDQASWTSGWGDYRLWLERSTRL